MILPGSRVNVIFQFLFVVATLKQTHSKIYLYRYEPTDSTRLQNSARGSTKNIPLLEILKLIKERDNIIEKNRKTCVRLFGSIHGTKDDRVRCLETLKKQRLERETLKESLLGEGYKQPFVDMTRGSGDNGGDMKRTPSVSSGTPREFSTDYIDFADLRSQPQWLPTHKYPQHWLNLRKSSNFKRKDKLHTPRVIYTSSEDDDESSDRISRGSKPKRFQVIDNTAESSKEKKYDNLKAKQSDSSDGAGSFASEEEKPIRKKPKRKIKKNNVNENTGRFGRLKKRLQKRPVAKEDSSQSGSMEATQKFVKPLKSKDFNKKELYLQGNHLIDLDGRRRLKSFLPKRFHWNEDEIHHLGYYWFNGPQGRYPFYAIRA